MGDIGEALGLFQKAGKISQILGKNQFLAILA
jgi:hypothetical protein